MSSHFQRKSKLVPTLRFISVFSSMLFFFTGSIPASAGTVAVGGAPHIINTPTKYNHVVLDLDYGFLIKQGGSLDIENSVINVNISSTNPWFAQLAGGDLVLKNNTFKVKAIGVTPLPLSQPLYQVIQVNQGDVTLLDNSFNVNQAYSVGFLKTNVNYPTSDFVITGNKIINFHGGVYLNNSTNAEIDDNYFSNVSLSNIFDNGSTSNFKRNIFSFPGNLSSGDAFDIVGSNNLTIVDNIIASSSNYGIMIIGSQNLLVDNNKITDGLSYGIAIQSSLSSLKNKEDKKLDLAKIIINEKIKLLTNSNITISNNYIAQNRYGLAAQSVNTLTVKNNYFIQKFSNNTARQFWTNNDNLILGSSNITWTGNLYKEAFTQDISEDNQLAKQFVSFPASGGVIWP